MLKTCPAWLEVTSKGFRVKEEAAAIVRRIFALAREGMGVHRITATLTRDGVPTLGKGDRWVKAYVYRILANPAAMGTYQPCRQEGKKSVPDGEAIEGYYPAVVSAEDWRAARAALAGRDFGGRGAGRRGKGDGEANLFTALIRCARTGERMHLSHALGKKNGGERKHYVYLCPAPDSGAAPGARVDYAVFEAAVLSLLREVRPADIVLEERQANGRKAEIARLSGRILDIDARLEKVNRRARSAEDFDTFLDLIEGLKDERKRVAERRDELEQEEAAAGTSADLGEMHSLIDLLAQASPEDRPLLRRRLKARIRQLVADVLVLIVPRSHGWCRLVAVQLFFRAGTVRNYLIRHHSREGRWWARSLMSAIKAGDLDLHRPEDAAALEEALAEVDLAALEA
jgi:hypothetical protein